jgi:hypothetical protein
MSQLDATSAPQTQKQTGCLVQDCDCGGIPHGQYCNAVLKGRVAFEPLIQLPPITTIHELQLRFAVR